MLGLDFEILYRPGCKNKATNALSMKPEGAGEMQAILMSVIIGVDDIQAEVTRDEELRKLVRDLHGNPNSYVGYSLKNGRLMYKGRIVIPKYSKMVPKFLTEFHSSPLKVIQVSFVLIRESYMCFIRRG